jgi:pimeloyl-ACP methyl ester carboxylesterase
LVDAGWRVVSWDQRGHGDSDRANLYSWDADVRDMLAVLDTVSRRPIPIVGHSKGAGLMMDLAQALPHRVSHVVNLDGLPSRRRVPDVVDHERSRAHAAELTLWLDRRRTAMIARRNPGTLDDLAKRRQRMNPRLPINWLRYVATIGAVEEDDGWRWKLDPTFRPGGIGPYRPEWSMLRLPGLAQPFLGVLGLHLEEMGWGTTPDDVYPYLPRGARFETLADSGHFVHIEQPARVAELVLEHLGSSRA